MANDLSYILLVKSSTIKLIRTKKQKSDSNNFTNYVLLAKSMNSLTSLTMMFGLEN